MMDSSTIGEILGQLFHLLLDIVPAQSGAVGNIVLKSIGPHDLLADFHALLESVQDGFHPHCLIK